MTDPIKRRTDGSIDTTHYMAHGRILRANAAREMMCDSSVSPARRQAKIIWIFVAVILVGFVVPLVS